LPFSELHFSIPFFFIVSAFFQVENIPEQAQFDSTMPGVQKHLERLRGEDLVGRHGSGRQRRRGTLPDVGRRPGRGLFQVLSVEKREESLGKPWETMGNHGGFHSENGDNMEISWFKEEGFEDLTDGEIGLFTGGFTFKWIW